MQTLTLAVSFTENIAIPSDSPIITFEEASMEIMYSAAYPEVGSTMSLNGSALVVLGGFDASITFRMDHTADEINAFMADDFTPPTAPTSGDR